jgi:hypothetical protein
MSLVRWSFAAAVCEAAAVPRDSDSKARSKDRPIAARTTAHRHILSVLFPHCRHSFADARVSLRS